MNTSQLKYFLSAAKNLSFSEAAKEFYMTQPAISHQIVELEQELGAVLFNRTPRGVQLTKAGELFLKDAIGFLAMTEHSKERLRAISMEGHDKISIGFLLSPCKYFLPEVIHQFRQLYPHVEVELHRLDAAGILSSIEANQYDIYFSLMEDLKHWKNYNTRKVHEDHYCLISRRDHPCLNKFKIDYNKLTNETFLMFSPDKASYMTRQIYQVCRDLNFTPHNTLNYTSLEDVFFAAEAGLGISILPSKTKDNFKANLAYTPLDSNSTACDVCAAWKEQENRPAVEWFMSVLRQYLIQAGIE